VFQNDIRSSFLFATVEHSLEVG